MSNDSSANFPYMPYVGTNKYRILQGRYRVSGRIKFLFISTIISIITIHVSSI